MNRIEGIRIGFVRFQRLVLLILGERPAFSALAECLLRRQRCQLGSHLVDGGTTLKLEFVPDGKEVLCRKESRVIWMMCDDETTRVAAQLASLAATPTAKSGHAYLDPIRNQTDFEIIASVGEYQADQMFAGA